MSAQEATVQSNPEVKSGVVPYLQVSDAAAAAEFYKRAFGAEEVARHAMGDDPRLIHVHLYINDGSVMLSDAFPEHGHPHEAPAGYTLHIQVDDADFWWNRAIEAGGQVVLPLQLMFWGDRYGQLRDPFGVLWSIATSNV
jgi:uncharacterized glyoxalase superfamily protein PhnB